MVIDWISVAIAMENSGYVYIATGFLDLGKYIQIQEGILSRGDWLAQSVEHATLDLRVVSSFKQPHWV